MQASIDVGRYCEIVIDFTIEPGQKPTFTDPGYRPELIIEEAHLKGHGDQRHVLPEALFDRHLARIEAACWNAVETEEL